ncbi:hypothetical protein BM1_08568 [Bipolaris maydis]|nr:hypothetical protein BM1_08568 [Bipolaris maydis]
MANAALGYNAQRSTADSGEAAMASTRRDETTQPAAKPAMGTRESEHVKQTAQAQAQGASVDEWQMTQLQQMRPFLI